MTIEFGRGKDKKKRKRRGFGAAKKSFMEGRKGGRKADSFEGVGGMLKDAVGAARSKDLNRKQKGSVIGGAAGYAAGVVEGKGRRGAKSLGEKGAAALGKAKDYMSKAKSAAGELTGKAKSAVSSGYSAVKEKAQDVLKKRKRGSSESYARAIEALEFEVAKQVGILEFASGRSYIEFAGGRGKDKQKRKRRIATGAAVAGGVGLAAGIAAKNPKAIRRAAGMAMGGAEKAGMATRKGIRRGVGLAAGASEKAGIAARKGLRSGVATAKNVGSYARGQGARASQAIRGKASQVKQSAANLGSRFRKKQK